MFAQSRFSYKKAVHAEPFGPSEELLGLQGGHSCLQGLAKGTQKSAECLLDGVPERSLETPNRKKVRSEDLHCI